METYTLLQLQNVTTLENSFKLALQIYDTHSFSGVQPPPMSEFNDQDPKFYNPSDYYEFAYPFKTKGKLSCWIDKNTAMKPRNISIMRNTPGFSEYLRGGDVQNRNDARNLLSKMNSTGQPNYFDNVEVAMNEMLGGG